MIIPTPPDQAKDCAGDFGRSEFAKSSQIVLIRLTGQDYVLSGLACLHTARAGGWGDVNLDHQVVGFLLARP